LGFIKFLIIKKEITGNYFYDPDYNQKVDFIYGKNSLDINWWNKTEPIWITAQKQVKTKYRFIFINLNQFLLI
jgi:hypothetical protein